MRVVWAMVVAALLGAGCVSEGGVVQPPPGAPVGGRDANAPTGHLGHDEEPTFCESAEGCDFWDDDYHEFALYEVDTAVVDVLIVPSASVDATSDIPAIKAAVEAWGLGIEALAKPWMRDAFTLNVYVLGLDSPPQAAMEDPEIVVLAAEYNPVLLFGIGLQLPANVCRDGETVRSYPDHVHDGAIIRAAECEEGGFTCVAINTNFLAGTREQLFDLVTHEVGHCLGGGHVGDALDFRAKRVPVHDIMSYQHDPEQVHCVSSLNVRVLEALYAPVVGATPEVALAPGQYLTMPRSLYTQVACT